jgi:hypothetical protein
VQIEEPFSAVPTEMDTFDEPATSDRTPDCRVGVIGPLRHELADKAPPSSDGNIILRHHSRFDCLELRHDAVQK